MNRERGCMTAKEYLRQYGQLEREIKYMLEERQRWVDLATRITPAYAVVPGNKGGSDEKIPAAVEQIIHWEKELEQKAETLIALRLGIEKLLSSLENPDHRMLLRLRYIQELTWERVAEEMHYSYQWVCILHGRALQAVKELILLDNS